MNVGSADSLGVIDSRDDPTETSKMLTRRVVGRLWGNFPSGSARSETCARDSDDDRTRTLTTVGIVREQTGRPVVTTAHRRNERRSSDEHVARRHSYDSHTGVTAARECVTKCVGRRSTAHTPNGNQRRHHDPRRAPTLELRDGRARWPRAQGEPASPRVGREASRRMTRLSDGTVGGGAAGSALAD